MAIETKRTYHERQKVDVPDAGPVERTTLLEAMTYANRGRWFEIKCDGLRYTGLLVQSGPGEFAFIDADGNRVFNAVKVKGAATDEERRNRGYAKATYVTRRFNADVTLTEVV